jgi:hypothetical protein
MLMIGWELPRTKSAGWARRACRIKHWRILLIENTSASTNTAFLTRDIDFFLGIRLCGDSLLLRFHFDAKGPDETQELSAHGGDDLRFIFAAGEKFSVAQMQSVLRFPGDFFDFRTQTGLALEQVTAQPSTELIGPRGFDDHPSQMRVAGLGDAALQSRRTTRVFAGDQATVGHELPRGAKARDLCKLRNDSDGGDFCNSAEGLPRGDDRAHSGRRLARCFWNALAEPFDAHGHMLDFVNIVAQRHFLSGLRKVDFGLDPPEVRFRPWGFHLRRTLPAMAAEELAQAMSVAQLVAFRGFAGAYQVAECFVGSIGTHTGVRSPAR